MKSFNFPSFETVGACLFFLFFTVYLHNTGVWQVWGPIYFTMWTFDRQQSTQLRWILSAGLWIQSVDCHETLMAWWWWWWWGCCQSLWRWPWQQACQQCAQRHSALLSHKISDYESHAGKATLWRNSSKHPRAFCHSARWYEQYVGDADSSCD